MRRKWLARAGLTVVLLLAAGVAGIGWYYSGELEREAFVIDYAPDSPDLVVTGLTDDTITLQVTEESDLAYGAWRTPGQFGLAWDGGYARVGEILELADDHVVRTYAPMRGAVETGDRVRLDGEAFDGDPLTALGLAFETVTFPSELGPLDAWLVPGTSPTWAIFVHGKGSTREQALRVLPTFAAAGLPSLVVTYRNDEGAAPSASGMYQYGESEWRDLEAAVQYARDNGAKDVVLVGYSMGGAIVASFVYRSDLADRVRALVLDAPMLDFGDTVDFGAERRSLPGAVTEIGKTAAALRFGFDWRNRDYLRDADRLAVPILLFHGDADRLVHVRTSDRLAEMRPDIVTYVRTATTHVRSWNLDPDGYEQAVAAFLARVLASD